MFAVTVSESALLSPESSVLPRRPFRLAREPSVSTEQSELLPMALETVSPDRVLNSVTSRGSLPRSGQFVSDYGAWLPPVQYGAGTLEQLAVSSKCLDSVRRILQQLEPDDYLEFMLGWYRQGQQTFGANWRYLDLLTILQAASQWLAPRNYLEVGVRRGRSLAVVGATAPDCDLVGFDLWMPDYAGMPNPGPGFVREELQKFDRRGSLSLISGDSRESLPRYFAEHPGMEFDLITVDGDHSAAGARADLECLLPRLSVGGVLVMDDIAHPQHRYLDQLWDELVGNSTQFSCGKFRELGYGIAWAVRKE